MTLLMLLVFLVCAADAHAQRVKVADAVVVTKTRDTYTAVWRATEDGTLTTSGLTDAEYEALAGVNAGPPPKLNLPANRTWEFVSASKNDEYSTASGLLEPGNVYVTGEYIFVIPAMGEAYLALDKKAYTLTTPEGKAHIAPDPPGFEISNGEVHKK